MLYSETPTRIADNETWPNRLTKREPMMVPTQDSLVESESLAFPIELQQGVTRTLARATKTRWQTQELQEEAKEGVAGLLLAIENKLSRQAGLHLQQLEFTCNLNTALVVVQAAKQVDSRVKPFAVAKQAESAFDVKGHGYTWRLTAITDSDVIVPARHLEKLNVLRRNNIQPDSMYLAVPYAPDTQSVSRVIADQVRDLLSTMSVMLTQARASFERTLQRPSEAKKLPDPLLLVGFGKNPVVLVELARWV